MNNPEVIEFSETLGGIYFYSVPKTVYSGMYVGVHLSRSALGKPSCGQLPMDQEVFGVFISKGKLACTADESSVIMRALAHYNRLSDKRWSRDLAVAKRYLRRAKLSATAEAIDAVHMVMHDISLGLLYNSGGDIHLPD